MLGTYFYNDIIRTVTAVFGTLFNDISIKRLNSSGNTTSVQKVPLRYAPKQKWYARVFEDASDTVKGDFATKLPSMGFEMVSIIYDTARKVSHLNKVRQGNVIANNRIEGYTPPPYMMDYQLYCFSNKTTDWSQIVEQIIPFFDPTFNIPIKLIRTTNQTIVQDLHITLNSITPDGNYQGDFRTRDTFVWTLGFTLNTSFAGSFTSPSGVIKGAKGTGGTDPAILINMYDQTADDDLILDAGELTLDVFSVEEGDIIGTFPDTRISKNA